jgi:hypothetical protein
MAYVVARPKSAWEIRESRVTPAGPRARTLATFRTLDPEVIERARSRASRPLTADELRKAAHRAGAPVAATVPDRAAGDLLGQIAAGRRPRPVLERLLLDALGAGGEVSASARAAAAWIDATPQRRGETLRDLLLLTDRLPADKSTGGRRFPRLHSRPA